jgi:hypothetical protein
MSNTLLFCALTCIFPSFQWLHILQGILQGRWIHLPLGHILRKVINRSLTLSLTGVGPSGPALTYMQIPLKVQKVRYRQKLGIPQAGS